LADFFGVFAQVNPGLVRPPARNRSANEPAAPKTGGFFLFAAVATSVLQGRPARKALFPPATGKTAFGTIFQAARHSGVADPKILVFLQEADTPERCVNPFIDLPVSHSKPRLSE